MEGSAPNFPMTLPMRLKCGTLQLALMNPVLFLMKFIGGCFYISGPALINVSVIIFRMKDTVHSSLIPLNTVRIVVVVAISRMNISARFVMSQNADMEQGVMIKIWAID